ncbi:MAG TPA: 2-hydroxychromene-2-carboxylate isomerase [Burkholderiales bacterium]|nr:2-hydroxychromene-2-carboxylate isomerase [Burkholderiales bacterium]
MKAVPDPIEFYFDFSSPYGYFGATRISQLAANYGRALVWRPFLLGAVFKVTGSGPLPSVPLKGPYSKHDMSRCARFLDIPFTFPDPFPISTQAPARAIYWLEQRAPQRIEAAVLALYRAYFVDGRDISSPQTTADVLATLGLDGAEVLAAVGEPALKERLRNETQTAVERGVFGSPYVFVDGEPFWGHDRLDQVERWLKTGGF